MGEVVFYFFIVLYGKKYIELETTPKQKSWHQGSAVHLSTLLVIPAVYSHQLTLFGYMTEQGLPHILTLPLFILFVALLRLRFGLYESRYSVPLNWFIAAAGAWIMIHISEFLLESQKISPGLAVHNEYFELAWYSLGVILFWVGLVSFRKINHAHSS
ncbi:MAG: hypothetical protein ABI602_00280 [Candidatus Saccharibacteria bacterium]